MPGRGRSIGRHVLVSAHKSSKHAQGTERRGQSTLEHFGSSVIGLARESLTGKPVALFFEPPATTRPEQRCLRSPALSRTPWPN
jgi:hypothetical protein